MSAFSRYPDAIITSDTITARLKRIQDANEKIQNFKSLIRTNIASVFFKNNEILYKYVWCRELIVAPREMQTELKDNFQQPR